MDRLASFRLVGVASLCVGAIALGSATHRAASAAESAASAQPQITCATTSACLSETNTSSGPGLKSLSDLGTGIIATTKFKSTSSTNAKAGIIGQDLSATGAFDSGVLGTSTNGTGVQGISLNSYGMKAESTNNSALFVENIGTQDGIQAIALDNDGTNSSTQNPSLFFGRGRSGVWGHDDSNDGGHLNFGVVGSSTNGVGLEAVSSHYVGANVIGGGQVGQSYPALSVIGDSSLDPYITGCPAGVANPCDAADATFVVDGLGGVFTKASINALGNVDIEGQFQVNGTCVMGCASVRRGAAAVAVTRYVPTASMPTVEDFGEGQLVNGQARIRLGADFANVIDQRSNYLVFVTPEGDTNGVYVASKSAAGFEVRENRNGHSTVAFEYRIVAKPVGESGARLPMVRLRSVRAKAAR